MDWEKEYIDKIKRYGAARAYIYGAGQIAGYVYEVCHEGGIKIDGFAVSDLQGQDAAEKNGLPILAVARLLEKKEGLLLLIGAIESSRSQMLRYLEEQRFRDYIDVPEGIYQKAPMLALKKRRSMEITPIVGCSIQCRYCPQKLFVERYFERDRRRAWRMSFDQYKLCLAKLPKDTFIEFSGFVEPFLNPESVDMMEYTHEKGYAVSLFTTLTGLDKSGLERILKIPFERVVLHAPDKDQYAKIPVTEQYWELLEIILDTKRDDMTSFVTEVNCQGVPLERFLETARGRVDVVSRLHDRAGNLEADDRLQSAKRTGKIFCSISHQMDRNVLLPDGSVVLCCNDFGLQHILGNLLLEEYDQIRHNEEMRKIKRAMMCDESIPVLCRKCCFAGNLG